MKKCPYSAIFPTNLGAFEKFDVKIKRNYHTIIIGELLRLDLRISTEFNTHHFFLVREPF